MALSSTGIDLTALTVFFRARSAWASGFGLQKVVSNFISGVIILVDRSIKPGDTIELGETRRLDPRAARPLCLGDHPRWSRIPDPERGFHHPAGGQLVRFPTSWFASTSISASPMTAIRNEVTKLAIAAAGLHRPGARSPRAGVLDEPSSALPRWISGCGSGLPIRKPGSPNVRGKVLLALWDAFKENGVNIPFPHREIIMRTPVEVVSRVAPEARHRIGGRPRSKRRGKPGAGKPDPT